VRVTRRGRLVGYVLLFLALVALWSVLWWAAITGQEWKADRLDTPNMIGTSTSSSVVE